MRKLTLLTAALLLLMAVSSMATDTRTLTMGDNNMIMLDDDNIWLFPSRIFEYPKIAVGEFYEHPGNDFEQLGIHWRFGNDNPFVIGTYFTDLGAVNPTNLLGGSLVPFDFGLMDNRRFDFFYGNEISDFKLGTRISILNSGWEASDNTPAVDLSKESFSYYDFDFGLTSGSGNWDIAANVAFGSWTDENAAGQAETEPDGYTDLSVMGRYFWQRDPDYTFVPHVAFFHSKRGIVDNVAGDLDATTTADQTDKYTSTGFDLGFGINYTPASNILAVCDFGLRNEKWKWESETILPAASTNEVTNTVMTLPYFKIGLDADVFKWMDLRMGATSYWNKETDENKGLNNETKYNYAANQTYLGFGFHWNRLYIDTYTDPELFLNGFDFISGNGDGDMNFAISVVYEMH